VNRKNVAVACVAMAVVAGVGVYFSSRHAASEEAERLAVSGSEGVVNPDQSSAGMKTQPMPQLSDARFEPPPTITTGTYTDPKHRKPVEPKDKPSAR
jgi:hypothetical protein